MPRSRGVRFSFLRLGKGRVVRETALVSEDLIPPGESRILDPSTPSASNLRLQRSYAVTRPGYKSFADAPAALAVNGLHQALYDSGSSELIRCDSANIYRLNAGAWADIYTGPALGGGDLDTWAFAMVPRSGASTTKNQLALCNGIDDVNVYITGGGATTQPTSISNDFSGARAIASIGGRGLYFNCIDSTTARREQRVYHSIVGDGIQFTGVGAGFTDLADDPYPIANAQIAGGRVIVYKGNNVGGSVVVGTRTGNVLLPFRWDTVNVRGAQGSDIGLFLPRTLLSLGGSVSFFVGHDGFYLHDASSGFQRFADEVSEDLLSRVNPNALRAAHAWFKRATGEVVVAVATGGSVVPNEYWVCDPREKRAYGPWTYANASFLCSATYTATGDVDWNTLPWSDLTWDEIEETWDGIAGDVGSESLILGATDGTTHEDDDLQTDDDGTTISGSWDTPVIAPRGQQITINRRNFLFRKLETDDVLTCQAVIIRYGDGAAWTPQVQVTTDGGQTWTTISDGAAVAGGGTDRLLTSTYDALLPGNSVQARITGGSAMRLHSVFVDVSYAGNLRHV